jgi:hypothetical protein
MLSVSLCPKVITLSGFHCTSIVVQSSKLSIKYPQKCHLVSWIIRKPSKFRSLSCWQDAKNGRFQTFVVGRNQNHKLFTKITQASMIIEENKPSLISWKNSIEGRKCAVDLLYIQLCFGLGKKFLIMRNN